MITIFGKQDYDISTEKVIDWLLYSKSKFSRINGINFVEQTHYLNTEFNLCVDKSNVYWFRRWMDEDYITSKIENSESSNENLLKLQAHLTQEINIISRALWKKLEDCKWLSHPNELRLTKLEVLYAANEIGLQIPDTIITSNKADLIIFKEKHNRIINKSIGEPTFFRTSDFRFGLKTIEVEDHDFKKLPETFFPSLFQQLIDKIYEIRVFYLDGKVYPMVIFSQLDSQTVIDFRNYNDVKPNRTGPYKLPCDIENKLIELATKLKLTTGSFDLIKTENQYVFLEVNPVGQFGMTSSPCNYNIEKKIAEHLINLNNE